jgi:hypothetical protein
LKDLDKINPSIAKPKSLGSVGAFAPLIISACSVALADGAAPHIPFSQNPLSVFCLGMTITSLLFMLIPRIMNWDWQTKYFGIALLYVAVFALPGWISLLCIVFYGKLPLWISLGYLGINVVLTFWWCRRFVLLYRQIAHDPKLWGCIYIEDSDAVYYTQKGDAWLLEKKFKFEQFPSNTFVGTAMALAFLLIPFMGSVTQFVGVPFTHIFLVVAWLPINLMALGFGTRGLLIYYYYPWKIKRQTGKNVYVDMTSPSPYCK